jgi:hypothetical protein
MPEPSSSVSSVPSVVPSLSHAEIERELQRIFSKNHRSRLVALFGQGESGVIAAQGYTFQIVPTRCELELRSRMPAPAERHDPGLVFLIDWTDQPLPLDLACRMAGAHMYRIASDTRLASLFGARATDPELPSTALAKVLLSGGVTGLGKISGQLLRKQEAWRRFLHARLDFPLEGDLSTERLVSWAARNDKGPAFSAHAAGDKLWDGLRKEAAAFVQEETSVLGALAWHAWLAGQGERFVELCLVIDAVEPALTGGSYVQGLLTGQLGVLAPGWGQALQQQASVLSRSQLLDSVLALLPSAYARTVLDHADSLIKDAEFRKALGASRQLPSGYEARKKALGNALHTVSKTPSTAALTALRAANESLAEHRLHANESSGLRQQREMALRLAGYLTHRAARGQAVPAGPDYQEALDLADQYVREGAWVDWARQSVRGLPEPSLKNAVDKVLAKVDELRRDDDRRFATALVKWVHAGKPSHQVLTIADLSKRVIAEFLAENTNRKLLVVLLDGMSCANAVELVESVANEDAQWGRASWRPKPFRGSCPAGCFPPVFAALPTITQVSRAAFFAGKDDPALGDKSTAEDPNRWAANAAIRKFIEQGNTPVLLLKNKLMSGASVSDDAKKLIGGRARIVAVVVNAIDDQLKGSKQMRVEATVDHIKPLRDLLNAAAETDRAVLLVSDHGHVPGDVLVSRGQTPDNHARWRALNQGDPVADYEVALPPQRTWHPKNTAGVAAIWDDTACFGTPTYGEHGGLSLGEVVAPLVLIAPEKLWEADGTRDEGLRLTQFPEPDWWRLALPQIPSTKTVEPEPAKAPKPQPQLALPIPDATPPAPTKRASVKPPAPTLPALIEQLKKSAGFKAHIKGRPQERIDTALRVLAVLVAAGDRIPVAELARAIGIPTFQVAGIVAQASEILNADQYAILTHDRAGQQVVLDRAKLLQVFEL